MLRVFALRNNTNSWKVLPGGLVRIASNDDGIASMQRGGSSADVLRVNISSTNKSVEISHLYSSTTTSIKKRVVTSRAAENLFWFGRYTERSEIAIRLARLYLKSLNNEHPPKSTIWNWI
jgi:acetylornithine/succinyldiaminopimelate/putrescine aminotransferase